MLLSDTMTRAKYKRKSLLGTYSFRRLESMIVTGSMVADNILLELTSYNTTTRKREGDSGWPESFGISKLDPSDMHPLTRLHLLIILK